MPWLFFKTRRLESPYACLPLSCTWYHKHWLVRCLSVFIARSFHLWTFVTFRSQCEHCSLQRRKFIRCMGVSWLQSRQTHREYWPFMGQCERMFCVTQQEDFNSTPTGRCCFKLFHYRGTNRRRSEVSENKCVQFHGEIPLAKLSLHSCSEIVLFPLLWWSRILFFQFDFLFLSSVIFFPHLVTISSY